ncbi:MAG: NAD-dependent epimerase/dehydratase family protein [Vicinamibacterales bacterium]
MKVVITGICGFVGSELALRLLSRFPGAQFSGIDNFSRPGSETTRPRLKAAGVAVKYGDIRSAGDLEALGDTDWLIDAAANPSVLAGVDGRTSSRQIVEHNLSGTLNVLEFCKQRGAGLVLLSTSRVYSVQALARLPLVVERGAFAPDTTASWPAGASPEGIAEGFSTEAPISLYGATKAASEVVAQEYGHAFSLPIAINRCGVLAGDAQFGTAEQGIFSYWVRAWAAGRPLTFLGFDGTGHQVRDALHPEDLADLIERQIRSGRGASGIWNVGGGRSNAMSLAQVSAWCADRFGPRRVAVDLTPRRWDIPWVVMDSRRAAGRFGWTSTYPLTRVLDDIAAHHQRHPDWLSLTQPL